MLPLAVTPKQPDSPTTISEAEKAAVSEFLTTNNLQQAHLTLSELLYLIFNEIILIDDSSDTKITTWDADFIVKVLRHYERARDQLSTVFTHRQRLLLCAMYLQAEINNQVRCILFLLISRHRISNAPFLSFATVKIGYSGLFRQEHKLEEGRQ